MTKKTRSDHQQSETSEETARDVPQVVVRHLEVYDEVKKFTRHVEGLAVSFTLTSAVMRGLHREQLSQYRKYVDEKCEPFIKDGREIVSLTPEIQDEYNKLDKRLNSSATAVELVPRSLLVALVSQFDAFLGKLLRAIYNYKPEMLNASERTLSYAHLVNFESIGAAREYVLEKEIETVLRKSHSEQFDYLEKKFGMSLRTDLESWPVFIELTERRNLFVHADGIVSSQYLQVCTEQGIAIDKEIVVGKSLGVPRSYFREASNCILEIGIKLSQVLWRKLEPEAVSDSDRQFQEVCYEFLREKNYSLAISLLDFAAHTLAKRFANDVQRRIAVVNRAQAYKWSGKNEKAMEVMAGEDWTATTLTFQLAAAVISDDFLTAAQLVRRIGRDDDLIHEASYKEWPLFQAFRTSDEFLSAFADVYGRQFADILEEEVEGRIDLKIGIDESEAPNMGLET